ncbi:MAG: hypothetical protein WCK33_12505 [Phycisphaerae bacterium]|jgi:hypothetical protein
MSALGGTNPVAAAAIAGAVQQAATAGAKADPSKRDAKRAGPRREQDELIIGASTVEERQAIKALADNSQEQAHEDHQEHEADQPPRKPLDLEG